MINNKKILAIIPARSGSKGLPGKNIKEICGKPLIKWSIDVALDSKLIDRVIVSTDDQAIALMAQSFGAEAPFLRPINLAQDKSSSFEVVQHALNFLKEQEGDDYDYVVLLEPTSPMRTVQDVDCSIILLEKNSWATAIVGVSKVESQHPLFLVRVGANGKLSPYKKTNDQHQYVRRQDINDIYFYEGTVYISNVESLLEQKTFYQAETIGYCVPKWKSFEIDDYEDFIIVESIMKLKGYK